MNQAAIRLLTAPLLALSLVGGCASNDGVELSGGTATASAPPAAAASDAPPATPAPVGRVFMEGGTVWAEGFLSDPCWGITEPIVERQGSRITVHLPMLREEGSPDPCPVRMPEGYQWPIELPDGLAAGTYTVTVNGVSADIELP